MNTATPTRTEEPPLRIGLSLIGGVTKDDFYFHISMVDEASASVPETLEIIDPTTNRSIGGPFSLAEKDSIFCGGRLYETEAVDSSELPTDFWYEFNVEPFYVFVVTLREPGGDVSVVEVTEPPRNL